MAAPTWRCACGRSNWSMRSMPRRSRPVARPTGRPGCDPNTAKAITLPSSAIPTATASRPSRFSKRRSRPPPRLHPLGGHRGHLFFHLGNGARGLEQLRQNLLDPLGHQKLDRQAGADEVEPFHLLEQLTERLPEVGGVEDEDRFLVPAELRPGQLPDQLFER